MIFTEINTDRDRQTVRPTDRYKDRDDKISDTGFPSLGIVIHDLEVLCETRILKVCLFVGWLLNVPATG